MKNSIFLICTFIIALAFQTANTLAQEESSKTIYQAAADGDIDQINQNISNGVNVNQKNDAGDAPLHIAIRNKHKEAADLLIQKGADVNLTGAEGATPIYIATDTRQSEIINMLLIQRANINAEVRPGENALTLARRKGDREMESLLVQSGATMPMSNTRRRMSPYEQSNANAEMESAYRYGRGGMAEEPNEIPDFLKDPNEIKARVKKYEGLEKSLEELDKKSLTEMRQWQLIRADNRIPLLNTYGRQYESELEYLKTIAAEEKAKKTVKTIDDALSVRKERNKEISMELLIQRREQNQTDQATMSRGRGRARATRNTRGRMQQGTATDTTYGRGAVSYGTSENSAEEEQVDPNTQAEIDMWLDSTTDSREELANSIKRLVMNEIVAIRTIAEEEKANKTVAAIDGLLLNRLHRFDEFAVKIEQERQRQERLEQIRQQREQQAGGRTRGRGRGSQWNSMGGQQNQGRSRRR